MNARRSSVYREVRIAQYRFGMEDKDQIWTNFSINKLVRSVSRFLPGIGIAGTVSKAL
jgi:hypothetical protein